MKIFEGIIVSGGENKTVVVEVSRRTPHPLYGKLIRLSKKLKVDIGDFEVAIGNKVRIQETRPISKDKYFKIVEIIVERDVKKISKKSEVAEKEAIKVAAKKTKAAKKENK